MNDGMMSDAGNGRLLLLAHAGHGGGDVHRVLPALPAPDARHAQVVPGVHQRLQDHLRLEAVGDRAAGGAHEHRVDEADRGDRVGERTIARAGRQGEGALRRISQGRQGTASLDCVVDSLRKQAPVYRPLFRANLGKPVIL